ncbi:VOC family protein [Mariniblastus fucicola]|uniref:Glyoxalase-like domain protein n=1 Tax=Mariniblastus fucicola TaxID=980251 RepID=A0A5B9PF67_9BACT|nr:VOC family protein [Mariniblastus fucicola]QEG23835.1 Glyoxalase-like domain protein [Mariniblastus fucicola]
MKIYITSVMVDDQDKAFQFYTNVLGFQTKHDIPMGKYRWLTLTSSDDENGVQLALEPAAHPAVAPFRDAMLKDGIPWTSFSVDNLDEEHARLEKLGVQFTQPPTTQGGYTTAVFDDTCGNLIQIIQLLPEA